MTELRLCFQQLLTGAARARGSQGLVLWLSTRILVVSTHGLPSTWAEAAEWGSLMGSPFKPVSTGISSDEEKTPGGMSKALWWLAGETGRQ